MTYHQKLGILILAQVKSLVAGSNIPRKALDMLLTDLDQAKRLHFNDPHVEHQLFSHLFPLAQGGFIQGHKGRTLGKYNLLHVDRRGAHDKMYPFFLFDRSMKVQISRGKY